MLKNFFNGIKIEVIQHKYPGNYKKIEYDSRKIESGDIFVALEGEADDGHKYIDSAIQNGAKLIVVSKKINLRSEVINIIEVKNTRKILGRLASNFYGSPEKNLKIIGVTGTNGKTTTAYLLHTFLKNSAFIGSIGIEIGDKKYLPVNTTPESLDIIRYSKEAVEAGSEYLILEVSSQGIDNFRVEGLEFDGVIFTNLSREHLDYHKDMEEYFSVKERLFSQLKEDGTAVIFLEDEYGKRLEKKYKDALTYGLNSGDYRGEVLSIELDKMTGRIEREKGSIVIETSLVGGYNLLNILAATAMAEQMGEDFNDLPEKLKKLNYVKGRMQVIEAEGVKVIVDYAHTEDALENVLSTLKKCKHKKLYTLISGTGERYSEKRSALGRIAEKFSDYIMISSNSPRNEDPLKIAQEVASGIRRKRCGYDIEVDRNKAVEKIVKKAGRGDIVILTGKGHERYQEVQGKREYYNEEELVRKILRIKS